RRGDIASPPRGPRLSTIPGSNPLADPTPGIASPRPRGISWMIPRALPSPPRWSRRRMPNVSGTHKLAEMEYRVVKSLGTGAGSTILLIQDKNLGDRFALKVVKRQDASDDIYIAQAQHEF